MRGLESAAAVLAALTACVLGALSVAYRRTLVRLLRERHEALWEELGRPPASELPWDRGARRLRAFLRAGRHYALNDADVAAAGRLLVVTERAAAALAAVATGVVVARWLGR